MTKTKIMRFGVPYKGSKNGIVKNLFPYLPKAAHFYDLFAGGCAMTHAALLSRKFEHCHANDLDGMGLRLFLSAINGDFRHEKRWISRTMFQKMKDSDPYVQICWSFGNNQTGYLYSQEIEPWKRALHYARVLGNLSLFRSMGIKTDGTRRDIIEHQNKYKRQYVRWWLAQQKYTAEELDTLMAKCKDDIEVQEEQLRQYLLRALRASGLTQRDVGKRLGTQMEGHYFGKVQWSFPTEEHYHKMQKFMPLLDRDYNEVIGLHNLWQSLQSLQRLQSLESLQSLQRLESLQRLQSLQRLESLQSLEITYTDYRRVKIMPDSVIYCDPPYIGTDRYGEDGSDTANFSHAEFYDWCCKQKELVIISEYSMPQDKFACVAAVNKVSLLGTNKACVEKLFVPRHQFKMYLEKLKTK